MNIYVASSWRNEIQPNVVKYLRAFGHTVYDFRHPAPDNDGFAWSQIDPNWREWSPTQFREALEHPIAQNGFALDMAALRACHACVLVLPCGKSAHAEVGWAAGAGKKTCVYMPHSDEPELMYLMFGPILTTLRGVALYLSEAPQGKLFARRT